MAWFKRFIDPINLPDGRKLRDAAEYITALPKAEHDAADWQVAQLEAAIEAVKQDARHASMMPFSEMGSFDVAAVDRVVHVKGFYGAENAAMRTLKLTVDKRALLDMFCKANSIG